MNNIPVRSYPAWSWPAGSWPDLPPQLLVPSGLAVGVAIGTAVVGRGAVNLAPSGLAVGVAYGTATVSAGAVDITPEGLAVGVAFGLPVVVLPGLAQAILPEGLVVTVVLGALLVTRRAAVDVPLLVVEAEGRVWTLRPESRVMEVTV